jgi:hypothetical protein
MRRRRRRMQGVVDLDRFLKAVVDVAVLVLQVR